MKEMSEKEGWTYQAVKYWMTKHKIPRKSASEICYYTYWNRQKQNPLFSGFGKSLIVGAIKNLYYEKKLSVREVSKCLGRSINSIY